ncbi:hypothetical protein [Halosimplex marinum]|uniref:hypothetical protein n=1 Tax=Halosimplex marinum TaxID=3396620 RepID=UPI003F55EF4F
MRRRDLLAAVGAGAAGFAGCQTRANSTDSGTPTPPACEGATGRRVTLADTADVPGAAELVIDPVVLTAHSSPESPARVRIELANTGARREANVVDDTRCHLFNRNGRSDDGGLWLYRSQDAPGRDERAGECWTLDRVPDGRPAYRAYSCGGYTLASGGQRYFTYEVWDDYLADGYMRPGTYRFTTPVRIGYEGDVEAVEFDWWLELDVQR